MKLGENAKNKLIIKEKKWNFGRRKFKGKKKEKKKKKWAEKRTYMYHTPNL